MSEKAKQLLAQLHDFRTRKSAMDALRMLGDEAAADLVDALAHPMDNVRWCARTLLAELASDAIIERLIEVLDDPKRQERALEALRQISGESIGVDRHAWAEWSRSHGRPAPAPAEPAREAPREAEPGAAPEPAPEAAPEAPTTVEPLSDDALVEAAIADTGSQVEKRAGGFIITVPIEAGRHQRVSISFAGKDFEGEPLVVVYTECGPAKPKNFEWALRQNLRMSFGAIAVRDRDDQPTFVMVNTHPRAAASPEELRKSILVLARKGDALEKALTKGDER